MIICVHLSPEFGCDGQLETLQQPLFQLRRHSSQSETLSKFIMGHFQSVVTEVCRVNRTENRTVHCQCRQFSPIKCPSNGQLANTKFSVAIIHLWVSSPTYLFSCCRVYLWHYLSHGRRIQWFHLHAAQQLFHTGVKSKDNCSKLCKSQKKWQDLP